MKDLTLVFLVFALLSGGCGGGDEKNPGAVNITSALTCAISMGGTDFGMLPIPVNCGVSKIEGDSFETDQSTIHLAGSSFGPVANNCSNPTIGDLPCLPIFPGSKVQWENLSNGATGVGSSGYHVIGFLDPDWFVFSTAVQGSAGWSTYPSGIPLDTGPNLIRVYVEDADRTGSKDITVIRVAD